MTVAQLVDICLVWTAIRIFYETIKISVFYINQKLLVTVWLGDFYSSSCRNKHLRWHWVKGAANGEDREDLSRRSSLYQWCSEGNWSSSYRLSCSRPSSVVVETSLFETETRRGFSPTWGQDQKRVKFTFPSPLQDHENTVLDSDSGAHELCLDSDSTLFLSLVLTWTWMRGYRLQHGCLVCKRRQSSVMYCVLRLMTHVQNLI